MQKEKINMQGSQALTRLNLIANQLTGGNKISHLMVEDVGSKKVVGMCEARSLNLSNLQDTPQINRALTRLSLISNQLTSKSSPANTDIGIKKIDSNLIAVPLVIPFDKKGEPILDNPEHKKDYKMLRNLFRDSEVMKSTGFNFGMTLTNDQLHPIMASCVRHTSDKKDSPYGLYKIYDKSLDEYVGVQGMMVLKDKEGKDLCTPSTNNPVVESLTLVDSKHLRSGYGSKLIDWSFSDAEKRGDIVMYTVRIDNAGTKAICKKHKPIHLGLKNVGGKEDFRGKVDVFITLNSYNKVKDYPDFCETLLGGQTSATQTNQVQKKQLSPSF